MVKPVLTISLVLVLLLAGCGGSSDSDSVSYRPFDLPAGESGKRTIRYAEDLKPKANGLVGSELKPIIPDRPPPEFLVAQDLIDGIGPMAFPGNELTVQFVGAIYDSKKKFASSWDEGKPFTFVLGNGETMQGWEEGIEGMEVSDRRELVIPAELTTGGSRMKDVPTGTTLVYVIDLLDVKKIKGAE